ncbi:2-aminoethylphosphonate ABC transporter permease subunit [Mangrovactinospora gilvigrisea]|uniref:2-aminoethylphosphonate ABC transporter permease subunit n=1 Tax=Mangrovactinospora gilvigrisea TaxID=1428644 RepID=A0A1J7BI45_9ACTN|nr:2-aminoethylphosphonate ABC transporter permease subunit [Mangrovactinospora gilvigrisea]OIV38339.1 2-aminoethylphosphonate ABC transporter permease subunit [Mangrovactinospora gilvigrisea]
MPGRRVGRPRTAPTWLWALPPLAALAVFFLYPLALVAWQSVSPDAGGRSLADYGRILTSTAFTAALGNTLWIAVGATLGCLVLGLALSLVIAFVPFPGGRLAARLVDVFLSFPSFLITLALLFIYGTTGIIHAGAFLTTRWSVLLAEVTYFTPFVMRPLLAAFSRTDTALLEAAAGLGAGPLRIIRRVILPEAWPALAAGGALVLVLCLNEFGIVLFIGAKGVTTLPVLIYSKAMLESDYPGACVIAVVNTAVSVALYALYRVLTSRATALGGGRRAGA